jgi:hypothetical protein
MGGWERNWLPTVCMNAARSRGASQAFAALDQRSTELVPCRASQRCPAASHSRSRSAVGSSGTTSTV